MSGEVGAPPASAAMSSLAPPLAGLPPAPRGSSGGELCAAPPRICGDELLPTQKGSGALVSSPGSPITAEV